MYVCIDVYILAFTVAIMNYGQAVLIEILKKEISKSKPKEQP